MAVDGQFDDINVKIVLPGEATYLAAMVRRDGEVESVVAPPDADVIVMQRPSFPQLAKSIPHYRKKGIAVVVDIDDDLAHIDPANPAWLAMHPDADYKRERYAALYRRNGEPEKAKAILEGRAYIAPHSWKEVENACRAATMVTVSTPALADVYGRGHSAVLRNYIPRDFLRVPRLDSDKIGWAGSTHSHPGDLAAMGGSIRTLLRDGSEFMVVGNSDGADRELGLNEPVPATGAIDYDKWISAVSQIGVGVAPLADNRFNRGKSWLKPLEYSAAGVPWVASPRIEYEALHRLGAGRLARKDRDWTRALRELVTNERLRESESEAARHLASMLTIEDHAWRWAEIWTQALARQRGRMSVA